MKTDKLLQYISDKDLPDGKTTNGCTKPAGPTEPIALNFFNEERTWETINARENIRQRHTPNE